MRLFFITVLLIPARFVYFSLNYSLINLLDLFQFDASFLLNYSEFMFCLNDLELLLEVTRILTCLFNLLI
jgi:flagellar biosynthesis regulator FlbT